jgi:hypothetical protein
MPLHALPDQLFFEGPLPAKYLSLIIISNYMIHTNLQELSDILRSRNFNSIQQNKLNPIPIQSSYGKVVVNKGN